MTAENTAATTTTTKKYTVEIPTFGWTREQIAVGEGWQGNLSNPVIMVEKELGNGYQLRVELEDTGDEIEITNAEKWRWVEQEGHPGGGFWLPIRLVSPKIIELVEMGQGK